MKVEVRLYANLRDRLPDAERGRATLDLPDGTSLLGLLEHLAIDERLAQMVLVNGSQAGRGPAVRARHRLADGDEVVIFPPLAGG